MPLLFNTAKMIIDRSLHNLFRKFALSTLVFTNCSAYRLAFIWIKHSFVYGHRDLVASVGGRIKHHLR